MGDLDFIRKEWGVIKNAPFAFAMFIVIGFAAGMFWRGQEVVEAKAALNAALAQKALAEGKVDSLQTRFEDRITKIEGILSAAQLSSLESELGLTPYKVEIQTSKANGSSARYGTAFEDVFNDSGWTASVVDVENRKDFVLKNNGVALTTIDDVAAIAISKALDKAQLPYTRNKDSLTIIVEGVVE